MQQWVDLGGEAEVKAWTAFALDDDKCVVQLASAATQISRSHREGDRVTRDRPVVHRPGLEKILDVDCMIERLDAIAAARPDDETEQAIRNFKHGLNRGLPFARDDEVN